MRTLNMILGDFCCSCLLPHKCYFIYCLSVTYEYITLDVNFGSNHKVSHKVSLIWGKIWGKILAIQNRCRNFASIKRQLYGIRTIYFPEN